MKQICKAIIIALVVLSFVGLSGAATLTNYSVGEGDGWFENSTSTSFLLKRGGIGDYVTTAGTSMNARTIADTTTNNYTSLTRFYVQLDTSALPDGAPVNGATVYIYLSSKTSSFSATPFGVGLYGYTPTTYGTGVAGDYSLGGTTAISNIISNSSLTSSAYNAFTISDLTSINRTGYTTFMGKITLDANGTAPTWEASKAAAANFATSESANDPYIVVNYTASTEAPTTGAVTDITSRQVTFHATTGGDGTGYFKWGSTSGNYYKWSTPNKSYSYNMSDYQYGSPMLSGKTYYVVACNDYGCGNEVSFDVPAATFPNKTSYGLGFTDVLHSGFNSTVIIGFITAPYTTTMPGGAPVTYGLMFFFIIAGYWLRHRDITIPCMLAMVSGGAIWIGTSALGVPPEFAAIGQGILYASIAGMAVSWFSK